MQELLISVSNRVAKYVGEEKPVCDNKYKAVFIFDDEWDGIVDKKVRFLWNGQYKDVDLVDDACEVPVVSNTVTVQVGVIVGDRLVTTPAEIPYRLSILCGEGAEESEFVRWKFDDVPTEGSENPVKSGGVYADFQKVYKFASEQPARAIEAATPDILAQAADYTETSLHSQRLGYDADAHSVILYKEDEGVCGAYGSVELPVAPTAKASTIMERDENGYAEVLTPDIQWGTELTDEEKHKAVNVEALDAVARIVAEGCDDVARGMVDDATQTLSDSIANTENSILSSMDIGDRTTLAQARRYTDELYESLWDISIAETDVQDKYATRETADGMSFISGSKCTLKQVQGDTMTVNGALVNATFEGIKSVNESKTDSDELMLATPIELAMHDTLDVETQTVTRATTVATFPYDGGSIFYPWAFNASKGIYVLEPKKSQYKMASDAASSPTIATAGYSQTTSSNPADIPDMTYKLVPEEQRIYIRNSQYTTIDAFLAYLTELANAGTPLIIAYKGSATTTEKVDCPAQYTAWVGGTETVLPSGQELTITQSYIQRVGGGV